MCTFNDTYTFSMQSRVYVCDNLSHWSKKTLLFQSFILTHSRFYVSKITKKFNLFIFIWQTDEKENNF